MLQIRHGVFETNSSSTHSITMCTDSEYQSWKNGEVYLNDGWWSNSINPNKDKKFITREEAIGLIEGTHYKYHPDNINLWDVDDKKTLDSYLGEYGVYSNETYNEDYWFEDYIETYTTPGGEKIVAFGYYGHD